MSVSKTIPAVLLYSRGSISTLRVLKHVKSLLEELEIGDDLQEDDVRAALDDLDTMIEAVD